MASGQGDDDSGGAAVLEANIDREGFVRSVVDEFERNRLGVSEQVVHYVLSDIMRPEVEWNRGWALGQVDLEDSRRILLEAFERAQELTVEQGRYTVELDVAATALDEIVHKKYRCKFPFFC